MREAVEQEIVELHETFEDWFLGRLEHSAFERIAEALAEDFSMISPRGARDDRASILEAIGGAKGGRQPPFTIDIRDVRVVWQGAEACLVTYEEHQHAAGEATARISTALFRARADAPRGVEWVHLHETWCSAE